MKIGKYIFVLVPRKCKNINFGMPYNNKIMYETGLVFSGEARKIKIREKFKTTADTEQYLEKKRAFGDWKQIKGQSCKHLKPNTGIQYKVYFRFKWLLIIKQIN